MMIKSYYNEGLFFQSSLSSFMPEMGDAIRSLLVENHGVGILGGFYDDGPIICIVSELTLRMLGYATIEEFEAATDGHMSTLTSDSHLTDETFRTLSGACELHMRGKSNPVWTRLVKRNLSLPDGRELWLASVCDMEALYQKDLLVTHMVTEQHRQQQAQQKAMERAYQSEKAALQRAWAAQARTEALLEEVRGLNRELENANRVLEQQKAELERAYTEARLANAAKSDFLARMSHDIRTPINGILGLAEISERYADDPEKLRELRAKSRTVARHLLSLVNDVLDMSKLESGSVELTESPLI